MKSLAIIGAGQMGRSLAELINRNQIDFIGFGDNDKTKWSAGSGEIPVCRTGSSAGDPVMSVEETVAKSPDSMLIGVSGGERSRSLERQIRDLGYKGQIHFAGSLHEDFDLRSRCIKYIIERVLENGVEGAVAELGVYKGDTAWQINALMPERRFYLFDTFEGFDERDVSKEENMSFSKARLGDFSDTSVESVMKRFIYPRSVIVRKGYFPETAEGLENERFAFVSMDPDLYGPVLAGLRFFYPRLSKGGSIMLHDYNNEQFKGVKTAVREYEKEEGPLSIVPLGDLHGSCVITK
ncbi:MAG: class I SAM-dependent methyltransferase [Firmicutes bacterium]|nr:class I SAM-dependent methyltransferase [Bacillota bacterium]